jgi:enolase
MINLFSGGRHAGGQVSIQDVLIVPLAAATMDEAMTVGTAVFRAAAQLTSEQYGMRLLTADEGGLAPPFADIEAMFADALAAVAKAGYRPGSDVALAVDVAATQFYERGAYVLEGRRLTGEEMVERLLSWLDRYPIISLEDGLAEDDWAGWSDITKRLGRRVQLVGDDLFVTNTNRLRRGIELGVGNSILVKLNQIGTLTETLETIAMAREHGYTTVISHRSGETEDSTIADLAVAVNAGQIKTGSPCRGERTAKYNQLLRIEEMLGRRAQYPGRSAFRAKR